MASEATGDAQLSGGDYSSNIDQHTAEKVAKAVTDIVKHAIDNDYKEAACLSYLSGLETKVTTNKSAFEIKQENALQKVCLLILEESIAKRTNS